MVSRNILLFIRLLSRQKIFFFISASGLAVGMASFFLIFIYVNYEISFDSFHGNSANLYRVSATAARMPVPLAPALQSKIAGVEKASRMIFTSSGSRFIVRDSTGNVFEENGYYVDSTFFDLFSFNFIGSRPSFPLRNPNEAIITRRLAEKYFKDGQAINKTIEFANRYFTDGVFIVTGVIENLPANSQFDFDILVPYSRHGTAESTLWTNNLVYTFVKLNAHANPDDVLTEVKRMFALEANFNSADLMSIQLQPFTKLHFDNQYTSDFGPHNRIENIIILSSVAGLILLIACINFINISTAKASERMKEVGLRKTVGAAKSGLVTQFIFESVMISVISSLGALGIVYLSAPWFETLSGVNFSDAFALVRNYLLPICCLPVLLGILAGFYPAYIIAGFKPLHALKGQVQFSTKSKLRNALVITQFGITGFLIISTLVITDQLKYILRKDLGFDNDQVVVLNVGGPGINDRIHTFRQALSANSNVINVSGALTLPGDLTYSMPYSNHEHITDAELSEEMDLAGFYVDHEFVNNMGLEVVEGRSFLKESGTDTLNFMLNEAAVKEFTTRFGNDWSNPIGKRLNYFRSSDQGWYLAKSGTVIGVVKDFHFASLHHEIKPLVIQVDYNLLFKVLVKIRPTEIQATMAFMRTQWEAMGMERPFNFQFMDDRFAMAYEKEQKFNVLFKLFTIISILISCMGLYGLVLYNTERRSKEISIRKVLGANTASVIAMLGKGFIKPVLWAFLIVSPVAYIVMSNWLQQFAFHESITPTVFIQSGFVCIAVSIATIFFRTLKVSNANPVKYLKEN